MSKHLNILELLFNKNWLEKILNVTLCFAIITNTAYTQDLKFDHYSVDKGLSQANVWDIKQDKFGFIWIATEDGLNLFDGYSFAIYKNIPDDPTSLSNNNINSIEVDKDGNIWVATREGLNRLDRTTGKFEQYLNDPNDQFSLRHNNISNVYLDSKNNIWVCSNDGLSLYMPNTNDFKHFLHDPNNPESLAGNYVRCIVEDQDNRLWVGTMQGLSLMNADRQTFKNFRYDPDDSTSISSNEVMSAFVDSKNTIWLGTFDNGLNRFVESTESFIRYLSDPQDPTKLAGAYVYNISEDSEENIWISNDGALCLMDRSSGTFNRYMQDLGDDFSINSNTVTDVFFDLNDRMWVGTRFGGVNVYDKGKYVFTHYKHNSNNPMSLSANNIQGMDEDDEGFIWIGVDGGGLNKFDHSTNSFEHFRYDPANSNSIANDKVLALEVDQFGVVWTGMWAGGVTRYNPSNNTFTRYQHDPNNPTSLSDDNIFDFYVDQAGEMWIVTWGNGINKYNRETDDFTQYTYDPNDPASIGQSSVVCIMQDSRGTFWIGTENEGISSFEKSTGRFTNYRASDKAGTLSSNGIYSIFEDSKERLWIGTSGAGLNLMNRETGTFKVFRISDGLPNEAIVGILEDDNQNLWLSTNRGLSKFNPDSLTFKNYTESDGLQGDQFNRWSYLKVSSGELIFGGTNGFNIFNPNEIKDNPYVPPVYITDFKLFNEDVPIGKGGILTKEIMFTDNIELSYSQNMISFEFTALNYRQTEKNQYKYILEGFQDDWIDIGNERKVTFTNLDPGDYLFKVIGSNNNDIWNEEGVSLAIKVVPPFWRTWWFIAIIALAALYGIYRYLRNQRISAWERQRELETIIEERTSEVKKQNEEIKRKAEEEREQNWVIKGLAEIGEVISRHKGSLTELSQQTIKHLIKYVDASIGMVVILNDDNPEDKYLQVIATYGTDRAIRDRIETDEGQIGACFSDKEKIIISELPENFIKIESGLGGVAPKTVCLYPLKLDTGEVLGAIELAFIKDVSDLTLRFLVEAISVIALNLHAEILNDKTIVLLQSSKEQTEELRAQEEEMRQNLEEMEATQEEFKRREQEYLKQIELLEQKLKEE